MDNKSLVKKAIDKITGKDSDESILNARLDRYFNAAWGARKEIDWRWFNYDLYVSGNHYARWDKNTQQILQNKPTDGRPKIVINKIYATLRSVRSYVLQNRPKAEVTPFNMTENDLDQAVELNQFLDYLHDHLFFRQKLRASMWHALKYSVGFWQVLFDESAEDGEGGIVVNVIDPYDLYWDPSARVPAEARYVILAVRRSLADLKEDPKYKDADWEKISSDKQLAASTMKTRLIQWEKGEFIQGLNNGKDGTVIVKEFWYKETVEEENEFKTESKNEAVSEDKKSNPNTKTSKTRIMLCTKIDDVIIRKPFDTGLNRFPFFRLCSDIEPLSLYGTGWVKNLVPANKLIDRGESSAAEYNEVANKARLIGDKGAGVRVINNEHGQFVEKKRGFNVEVMQVPPIDNVALSGMIERGNAYMEDLGSWHDASMGRQTSADQSGRSIEALQEGDSNNLSELIENTEEFLEDVYEYILRLASDKFQYQRNVITVTQTGERQFLKFIGESAAQRMQQTSDQPAQGGLTTPDGATVIPSKNIVDVKIASYVAYSASGRRTAMKDLVGLIPALPPEYILQAYAVGPVADIIKAMKQQQAEQASKQAQMQNDQMLNQKATDMAANSIQQGQQADQQQQQVEAGQAGAPEAIAFIRMLLNGQKPPVPPNVGPEFIKYLDAFYQTPEAQKLGPAFLQLIQTDRDQAVLQLKQNPAMVNGGAQ